MKLLEISIVCVRVLENSEEKPIVSQYYKNSLDLTETPWRVSMTFTSWDDLEQGSLKLQTVASDLNTNEGRAGSQNMGALGQRTVHVHSTEEKLFYVLKLYSRKGGEDSQDPDIIWGKYVL